MLNAGLEKAGLENSGVIYRKLSKNTRGKTAALGCYDLFLSKIRILAINLGSSP
jgi:hypothetical protein